MTNFYRVALSSRASRHIAVAIPDFETHFVALCPFGWLLSRHATTRGGRRIGQSVMHGELAMDLVPVGA